MMNETYIEVLIKRRTPPAVRIGQLAASVATGCLALVALLGIWAAVAAAAVLVAAAYFLSLFCHVEYEYIYVDKELQIDRILAKSRRKRMETLDMMQMELLAPLNSRQLDGYRGRREKPVDYSSGEAKQPEARYLLCMKDKQIILEPTEAMVKMIQTIAPRKVYTC